MRSSFANFLFGFTLPFGVTTGRRIEFDGPNGEIRIFDSLNRLRLQVGSGLPSQINLFTGAANENGPGSLEIQSFISGSETYLSSRLTSPSNDQGTGNEEAQIQLWSRSADGSEPPTILLRSRLTSDDLRLAISDDAAGTRTQPMGTAVLVAGTVTVLHSFVTASSRIVHWRQVAGGTLGHLSIGAVVAGTSFVINSSSATDTSTIGYLVVEPI